jgi:acetylglutamate kinase
MPELVELGVRGGCDGRVTMAEPDHGDARTEVEVRAAGIVPKLMAAVQAARGGVRASIGSTEVPA